MSLASLHLCISKWYLIGSTAAAELCLYHVPSVCQAQILETVG